MSTPTDGSSTTTSSAPTAAPPQPVKQRPAAPALSPDQLLGKIKAYLTVVGDRSRQEDYQHYFEYAYRLYAYRYNPEAALAAKKQAEADAQTSQDPTQTTATTTTTTSSTSSSAPTPTTLSPAASASESRNTTPHDGNHPIASIPTDNTTTMTTNDVDHTNNNNNNNNHNSSQSFSSTTSTQPQQPHPQQQTTFPKADKNPNPASPYYYQQLLAKTLITPMHSTTTLIINWKPYLYFIDYILKQFKATSFHECVAVFIVDGLRAVYSRALGETLQATLAKSLGIERDLQPFNILVAAFNSIFTRWSADPPFKSEVMTEINETVLKIYTTFQEKQQKQTQHIQMLLQQFSNNNNPNYTGGEDHVQFDQHSNNGNNNNNDFMLTNNNSNPNLNTTTDFSTYQMSAAQQAYIQQQYQQQFAGGFSYSWGGSPSDGSGGFSSGVKRGRSFYPDGTPHDQDEDLNNDEANEEDALLKAAEESLALLNQEPPNYSTNNLLLNKPSIYKQLSSFKHTCTSCGKQYNDDEQFQSHIEYHAYLTKLRTEALRKQKDLFSAVLIHIDPDFDFQNTLLKARQYYLGRNDWVLYKTTDSLQNIFKDDMLSILKRRKQRHYKLQDKRRNRLHSGGHDGMDDDDFNIDDDEEDDDNNDDDDDDESEDEEKKRQREEDDRSYQQLNQQLITVPLPYKHLRLNVIQQDVNQNQVKIMNEFLKYRDAGKGGEDGDDDDDDANAKNFLGFGSLYKQKDVWDDLLPHGEEDGRQQKKPIYCVDSRVCSLQPKVKINPPHPITYNTKCIMCQSGFNKVYSQDQEEWALDDALFLSQTALQKRLKKEGLSPTIYTSYPQYEKYLNHLIHGACFNSMIVDFKKM